MKGFRDIVSHCLAPFKIIESIKHNISSLHILFEGLINFMLRVVVLNIY